MKTVSFGFGQQGIIFLYTFRFSASKNHEKLPNEFRAKKIRFWQINWHHDDSYEKTTAIYKLKELESPTTVWFSVERKKSWVTSSKRQEKNNFSSFLRMMTKEEKPLEIETFSTKRRNWFFFLVQKKSSAMIHRKLIIGCKMHSSCCYEKLHRITWAVTHWMTLQPWLSYFPSSCVLNWKEEILWNSTSLASKYTKHCKTI